ncbi:MAG: DUF4214 domain-containing protein [Actinomycetota bacterium]
MLASLALAIAVVRSGRDAPAVVPVLDENHQAAVTIDVGPGIDGSTGLPRRPSAIVVPDGAVTAVIAAAGTADLQVRTTGSDWAVLAGHDQDGPDRPAVVEPGILVDPESIGEGPDLTDRVRARGVLLVEDVERLELAASTAVPLDDPLPVEVVFLGSADRDGGAGAESGPGAGEGLIEQVAGPSVAMVSTANLGQPAIQPRSAWTDRGWSSNSGCAGGPWYSDRIQAAIVHHTVTSNTYRQDQVPDLLRAIQFSHVDINGWCDVGYNFLVDRFGTIWEGRAGGADRAVIGGHAKGFNTGTFGIALLGQHQQGARPAAVEPGTASENAIAALARWKLGRHGVDPEGSTWVKNRSSSGVHRLQSGQWHLIPTVAGHRDVGVTSCPGSLAIDDVRAMGSRLVSEGLLNVSHRFDDWTPFDHGPGFVTVDARAAVSAAGSAVTTGFGRSGRQPSTANQTEPLAVAARRQPGGTVAGYTLFPDGFLSPFGGAPAIGLPAAGLGRPVDLALAGAGVGAWVVTAEAQVIGIAGAPSRPVQAVGVASTVVAAAIDGNGNGYLLDASGRLRAVGDAPGRRASGSNRPLDVALRPDGVSGWVLDARGTIHPFGGAPAVTIDAPTRWASDRRPVAIEAGPVGRGGWVMTDDGQLWPFGGQRLVLPLTTATRTSAVDVAVVNQTRTVAFARSADARYVTGVAGSFLGREPSADEVDYWNGWLTYRGGRKLVALDLARSPQWAGSRIDVLYQDVLGRPADGPGAAYWLQQNQQGVRLDAIATQFYGSPENVVRNGGRAGFVDSLYRELLGREADAQGRAFWIAQLRAGVPPDQVVSGFYASVESRQRRVRELYTELLGRTPGPSGLDYWVQRLGRIDDGELAAELAASDEFFRMTQR